MQPRRETGGARLGPRLRTTEALGHLLPVAAAKDSGRGHRAQAAILRPPRNSKGGRKGSGQRRDRRMRAP